MDDYNAAVVLERQKTFAMVPWFMKDKMRDEVRNVFFKFLEEVESLSVSVHGARSSSDHDDEDEAELAMLLVDLLGKCHYLLLDELQSAHEAALLDSFFRVDTNLNGFIRTEGLALPAVLRPLASPLGSELSQWIASIRQSVAPLQMVTFVDLLDWWVEHQRCAEATPLVNLTPAISTAGVLEQHFKEKSIEDLYVGLQAYQQTLVVTCSRACERRLVSCWTGCSSGLVSDVLLEILQQIHESLSPMHRALWRFFGNASQSFDAMLSVQETLDAIAELIEVGGSKDDMAADGRQKGIRDLIKRRAALLRQAVEDIFTTVIQGRGRLSIAELLDWWMSIDDDFRISTGLTIDAVMVHQFSIAKPSEMFACPLSKLGVGLRAEEVLCGHARLLAEITVLRLRSSFFKDIVRRCHQDCTRSLSENNESDSS